MTLDEATAILANLEALDAASLDGPVEEPGACPMLSWDVGAPDVYVFGYRFTVDELEAIVVWIRSWDRGAHPD